MRKLILRNFQSPGDILMLTGAVRDLHRCYPSRFLTDVRTSCPALWLENPYLTALNEANPDVEIIDCHYPLISESNFVPRHFIHGFTEFLNRKLNLQIEPTEFRGDIHLHEAETKWMPQVMEITGEDRPYWIVVAGGKFDYTIKWWARDRWQRVVDHFRDRIQFVQVGASHHHHPALNGVIDLRGKTDLRELVRLVHHAQGVLCPVTSLMHLAAAVPVRSGRPKNRACVVVAGGREPAQWEAYPHHQFISTNGQLLCCDQGGCWKARTVALGDGDIKDQSEQLCVQPIEVKTDGGEDNSTCNFLPRCMDIIRSEDVIARVEGYFKGGAYQYLPVVQSKIEVIDSGRSARQSQRLELGFPSLGKPIEGRKLSRPKRIIGVTIGVGEKWRLLARLAIRSFRASTGLDAYALGRQAMKRYGFTTPHHLKYKLFHEFPDADLIVYFDADIIFLQPFDVGSFTDRNEFVCVRDHYEEQACIREEAKTLRLRPEHYFNSGFFIVHREHHQVFLEKAQWLTGRFFSSFKDQTFLNGARHMLGTPILYLPREYNKLGFDCSGDPSRVVIGHFHLVDERPSEELSEYHQSWLKRGRAYAAQYGPQIRAEFDSLLTQKSPDAIRPSPPKIEAGEECYYRQLLEREIATKSVYQKRRFTGRGIVICGGGVKYFPCAWVSIKVLRHLGCKLPIELWHIGPNEMTPAMRRLLAPLGVATVDANEVRRKYPVVSLRGWELKAYSLLHCRFAEAMLIDADNVAVRDPSFLFDDPQYIRTGAIFWPDFWKLDEDNLIWRVMGIPFREEPAFESGQIVVDKRKCWKALRLACHLNEHSAFYYRFIHGDKDTFHMAWKKLHQPYAMPARPLEALEATMCQHDLEGKRLFQHRNADKWRIDGLNRKVPGFVHESICRQFLEELRELWFPETLGVRRWNSADADPELHQVASQLIAQKWYYHRIGYDTRKIRFRSDGIVGLGAGEHELYWHLRGSPSGAVLEIFSGTSRTCRLLLEKDGTWQGAWDRYEKMPVVLSLTKSAGINTRDRRINCGAKAKLAAVINSAPEQSEQIKTVLYTKERGRTRRLSGGKAAANA